MTENKARSSETVIIISGKNPLENPGGLGSYSLSLAKSVAHQNYNVILLCFGKSNKTIPFVNGIEILQLKVHGGSLFSAGSIFINLQLGRKLSAHLSDFSMKNISAIIGAGIWFRSGLKFRNQLDSKPKLVAAYFTTYQHEFKGHLKGSSASLFGPLVFLQSAILYMFALLFFSPYERSGLKKCDMILVHYSSTKDLLNKEIPSLAPKIQLLRMPNIYVSKFGNPAKDLASDDLQNSSINFLFVNRLDARKGLGQFMLAYKKFLEENPSARFRCDVVGSGHFFRNYEKLSQRLKLSSDIKFHGFLANPYELCTSKTVYILAALEEGSSSISLIEAMSRGLPSIVSDVDGMKEDIRDGIDGFLYDPYDVTSFLRVATHYRDDPSLMQIHGESAKTRFQAKFPERLNADEVKVILK